MPLTLPYIPSVLTLPSGVVTPSATTADLLIEQAIAQLLSQDAGVTALIADRAYAPVLPQTCVYPAIAWRLVNRDEPEVLNADGVGLATSTFRFFSCAEGRSNYGQAKLVDSALRLALKGFSGTITDGLSPESTIEIQAIETDGSSGSYDDSTKSIQIRSDFIFTHSIQIPT